MPEMTMTVRWPDGVVQECYSPSLVLHDYLEAGRSYSVGDFTTRSATALAAASERVRRAFGFACTSAAASSEDIRRAAERYAVDDRVQVLDLRPPLPVPAQSPTQEPA